MLSYTHAVETPRLLTTPSRPACLLPFLHLVSSVVFARYPNTARVYLKGFTGNADMPYDFFMSRYKEVNAVQSSRLCSFPTYQTSEI